MSRSCGGSAVTSPIADQNAARRWASPDPAIIRSAVLLPQPDGPTSTMNSPSAICEIESLRRDVPVGIGLLARLRVEPMPWLPFHRAGGESLHDPPLEREHQQRDRRRGDDRRRQDLPPGHLIHARGTARWRPAPSGAPGRA